LNDPLSWVPSIDGDGPGYGSDSWGGSCCECLRGLSTSVIAGVWPFLASSPLRNAIFCPLLLLLLLLARPIIPPVVPACNESTAVYVLTVPADSLLQPRCDRRHTYLHTRCTSHSAEMLCVCRPDVDVHVVGTTPVLTSSSPGAGIVWKPIPGRWGPRDHAERQIKVSDRCGSAVLRVYGGGIS
jgi:hypothetical protein